MSSSECNVAERVWARVYGFSRGGLFAPDLYIPLVALVTHVLLATAVAGVQGRSALEMLGVVASTDLAVLLAEIVLLKVGMYVLDVSILFTDLVACMGLAFAGVAVNCLVGFALGAPALILCWAATSFLMAIFTLRSLHVAIRACRQSSVGQPPRLGDQDILLPEQWFVHCAAAMQFLVIGYLSL
jgi:hypothetical protein